MIEIKIIEVFKSSGMTRVEFAEKLKISNATLSHLASGRNKASLDLVITVLNYFPEISADWLILDKGEMKRSKTDTQKVTEAIKLHLNKLRVINIESATHLSSINEELEVLK